MPSRLAPVEFIPEAASDQRLLRMLYGAFLVGALVVVIGIFELSWHSFEAYLDGAPTTDRAITHRLRNNSDHAGIFFVHIYTGNIALALGTLQTVKSLRSAHPQIHRWIGRLYVLFVLISAGMSFGLSPRLPAFGTGYGRQIGATLWASFTILGVIAIRNSDVEKHRRWMMRSYAFAYMGITFMILSAARTVSGIPLEYGYPIVIHMSFVVNMAVCEFLIWKSRSNRRSRGTFAKDQAPAPSVGQHASSIP